MYPTVDLQYYVNKLSFELLSHIDFFRGSKWDTESEFQSVSFLNFFGFPPKIEYTDSSIWQPSNLAVNKSTVLGSKYFL